MRIEFDSVFGLCIICENDAEKYYIEDVLGFKKDQDIKKVRRFDSQTYGLTLVIDKKEK